MRKQERKTQRMRRIFIPLFAAAMVMNAVSVFAQDPCYISAAQAGSKKDYVYAFYDGEVSPKNGETLLMVNGAFTGKAVALLQEGRALAPLRFIAETFGAQVGWNGEERRATLIIDEPETVIELTIGSSSAFVNGSEVQLDSAPVIINDLTYVPLRFVSEQLDKVVGYLPGISGGIGLAYNPVIWIDDYAAEADEDYLQTLKARFTEGLVYSKQKNSGGVFEAAIENVYHMVEDDIAAMEYVGRAGRYALYRGPYITLVGPGGAVYFYRYGSGKYGGSSNGIYKADFTDPELFWSGYIRG